MLKSMIRRKTQRTEKETKMRNLAMMKSIQVVFLRFYAVFLFRWGLHLGFCANYLSSSSSFFLCKQTFEISVFMALMRLVLMSVFHKSRSLMTICSIFVWISKSIRLKSLNKNIVWFIQIVSLCHIGRDQKDNNNNYYFDKSMEHCDSFR